MNLLPPDDMEEARKLLALHKYIQLQKEHEKLVNRQEMLREKFEQTQQLELEVNNIESDINAKRQAIGQLQVLTNALNVANRLKKFCEQNLEPHLRRNIPLNISDEEFEQLKG